MTLTPPDPIPKEKKMKKYTCQTSTFFNLKHSHEKCTYTIKHQTALSPIPIPIPYPSPSASYNFYSHSK